MRARASKYSMSAASLLKANVIYIGCCESSPWMHRARCARSLIWRPRLRDSVEGLPRAPNNIGRNEKRLQSSVLPDWNPEQKIRIERLIAQKMGHQGLDPFSENLQPLNVTP